MPVVTYSPAYTLVPTYDCFNHCSYCNFRTNPGVSPWLDRAEADKQLTALTGVTEILILAGEVHPHSPQRQEWFKRIYDLAELALQRGFFPHTNVGPLSVAEMKQLKQVNFSLGLMVEQVTPNLLETVHRRAPSKLPQLRLEQLIQAGELQIPFTTGILVGIGETEQDREDTLAAIATIARQWGHIQEVILQPYHPGETEILNLPGFDCNQLPDLISLARQILPPSVTIQIPPNLIPDFDCLLRCLRAGATDLGGIGPIDQVNPSYPHAQLSVLTNLLAQAGWELRTRLPVYPQYYNSLSNHLRLMRESQVEHHQNPQINQSIS